MRKLTQKNLEICFKKAKELSKKYVGLRIKMKGYSADEIIINPKENFDDKLSYYNHAYDDNLEHHQAEGICIVGFTYGDTFEEIEKDLI